MLTLTEIISHSDFKNVLVSLSSKTYVFEDKMTKYLVILTSYFFLCICISELGMADLFYSIPSHNLGRYSGYHR